MLICTNGTCLSVLGGDTLTYKSENLFLFSSLWSSWAWHSEGVFTLAATVPTLWGSTTKDITWHQCLARGDPDLLTIEASKCACTGHNWKTRMGWIFRVTPVMIYNSCAKILPDRGIPVYCYYACCPPMKLANMKDSFSYWDNKQFPKSVFIAFVYFLIQRLCILCIFYLIQCCFSLMIFTIRFYIDLMSKTLYLSIFVLPCSTLVHRLQIESLYPHID